MQAAAAIVAAAEETGAWRQSILPSLGASTTKALRSLPSILGDSYAGVRRLQAAFDVVSPSPSPGRVKQSVSSAPHNMRTPTLTTHDGLHMACMSLSSVKTVK